MKRIINKTKNAFKKVQQTIDKIKVDEKKEPEKEISNISEEKVENNVIDISTWSVMKAAFAVFAVWIFFQLIFEIKDILIIIFMAFFLTAALDPIVNNFSKYRIPRSVSVISLYIVFLGIFTFGITQILPVIAEQVIDLSKSAKELIENLVKNESTFEMFKPHTEEILKSIEKEDLISNLQAALGKLGSYLETISAASGSLFISIFSGITNIVMVMVLAFFIIMDEKGTNNFLLSVIPQKYRSYAKLKASKISQKIGFWLNGQVILCFSVGIGIFVGMWLLGVKYALALSFFAGIMELVPYVGVISSFIPAALVAANQSGWHLVGVIAIFAIVQQLEGNVLVPLVMKKATGLSPVVTIIAMLIGARIMSSLGSSAILGIILAVPVATIVALFVKEYTEKNLDNNKTKK